MTFWDICSPIYDFAQRRNKNYDKWLTATADLIDEGSSVLELAGGTGEISARIAGKAGSVV